ncbi:LPXTG cell wall anchor domain-containing protein [Staphylococcus aureus]|nr:LPXTG cell wall anchor domain-containing protein [Staphylococcus aureus]
MLPKTGETTSSQSWWGLYALLGMLALFIPKFRKEYNDALKYDIKSHLLNRKKR